jgi:DNA-binding PadR family transcriptional regulator
MFQSVWWWSGRCTLAHQSLLDNNALELKEYAERCFATAVRDVPEPVPGNDEGADDQLDPNGALDRACRLLMLVQVLVESAHVDFTFWNYRRMLSSLERAQLVSGLQSTLTGARGVRTKYQIDDKSQLYIDATSSVQVRAAEALVFPWMADASCHDSIELEKQHQAKLDERMELIRKRRRARQLERRKQQIENQTKQPQAAAPAQADDQSALQAEFVDPPTDEELDVEMPGWRESPAADKVCFDIF